MGFSEFESRLTEPYGLRNMFLSLSKTPAPYVDDRMVANDILRLSTTNFIARTIEYFGALQPMYIAVKDFFFVSIEAKDCSHTNMPYCRGDFVAQETQTLHVHVDEMF
jgi:hypothetical protein